MLGAALPGGSAVVDLVGQLLDCIHETAKDQIELDEAQAPAAAEADLKRVEEMFDVLSGDLAALTAQVGRAGEDAGRRRGDGARRPRHG